MKAVAEGVPHTVGLGGTGSARGRAIGWCPPYAIVLAIQVSSYVPLATSVVTAGGAAGVSLGIGSGSTAALADVCDCGRCERGSWRCKPLAWLYPGAGGVLYAWFGRGHRCDDAGCCSQLRAGSAPGEAPVTGGDGAVALSQHR